MAWRAASRAVAALISTRPPSARMRPDWRMSAPGAEFAGRHRDLQEAVSGEVEGRLLAGAEADLAEGDADHAGIRRPCRRSAPRSRRGRSRSRPCSSRRPIGRSPLKMRLPALKSSSLIAERRGDEGAGLDHAGLGDGDAVRVDEIDLAVGVELPGDGRGRVAADAVEEGRGGRGLGDVDAGARARSRSSAS